MELIASLSTDSAIMALRRMGARRGWPQVIWSDNATNFHGADTELLTAYARWKEEMPDHVKGRHLAWRFIDPGAPNQGGAWERLIRSVKTALHATLAEQAPREETLTTVITEIEHTVNSRPLTHVSVSPEDDEALTPNHFLIGSATGLPITGTNELADRKTWIATQALADMFWTRWLREYLPTLAPRDDVRRREESIRVGDVVIIADGKELRMKDNTPLQWVMCTNWKEKTMRQSSVDVKDLNLYTVKNTITNIENDVQNFYPRRLKYRSVRLSSLHKNPCSLEPDLEPGKDMLFHIRIYKPYFFTGPSEEAKRRYYRYSLFLCNLMMLGSQMLSVLRDRFVCSNDLEMRVDVSNCPDNLPEPSAKEVFPSGFLFINNVFYVDTREGCVDYSQAIREWAQKKDIGVFQHKDLCTTRLDEIVLRLGYPEVYVHQGNCEHIFTFSEIRLLGPSDPLHSSQYPCHTQSAINQLINCNVCAEFCAKWLISNCERVPFDPTVMCDLCFRQYLYKDGVKQCEFKAYRYRGNEMNVLKPQIG
ncbi:hypothetical protein K1T71_009071 [Dendrolimus kikuchii]|uniref:Uncharacterized protein n=1 Tax=Dendrolimus kikuchii TaxID=765133 RepID=A0ACC1CTI4_9NEOP|nr:hypothetical protein K1T71_009071 [Dendrolimus kikuchii]